jgi:phage FluMu gp28-like protein
MTLSSLTKSLGIKLERRLERYLKGIELYSSYISPRMPVTFDKFNDIIGLPPLYDGRPGKVFSYQQKIDMAINEKHRVIINKSRKIGVTETVLRSIAKNCFGRYAGYNVMIIAGNNQTQAQDILERFARFFYKGIVDLDGKKYEYHDIIKHKTKSQIIFFNDTRIHTYPASPEALRGPERVICIFFDEAAHVKRLTDSVVYDALKPNLANTNGDFIIVSTPNGRRGIFYDLWQKDDYFKMEIPYTEALGELLSHKFIDREKKDPKIDFEQEYCCKFTTSANAAFEEDMVNAIFTPRVTKRWEDIVGPQAKD